MIKNLNLVIARVAATGKIKVLDVSTDREASLEIYEKNASKPEFDCVLQIRNPQFSRRSLPAKVAARRAERAAEAEAAAKAEAEAAAKAEAEAAAAKAEAEAAASGEAQAEASAKSEEEAAAEIK